MLAVVFQKIVIGTAKGTKVSPNFLVQKLCISANFPHQEISWSFGIPESTRFKLRFFVFVARSHQVIKLWWKILEDIIGRYQVMIKSYNLFEHEKILLLKRTFSGLRQGLGTEICLKMLKNGFYFTLKSSSSSQDIQILVLTF